MQKIDKLEKQIMLMLKKAKFVEVIVFIVLCLLAMVVPRPTHAQSSDPVPCPEQGVWPVGCAPNAPVAIPTAEPCPVSGKWPAGCIPNSTPPIAGEPCPISGRWPAGCIPTTPHTPPSPSSLNLPETLYLFKRTDGFWRMKPGDTRFEQLSPTPVEGGRIDDVDVWEQDGRIAFITERGNLYVIRPGGTIETIVNTEAESGYAFNISSVDWSPDGTKLAYTVRINFREGRDSVPEEVARQHDGAWIIDINSSNRTHITANTYPHNTPSGTPWSVYTGAKWSPDGSKILFSLPATDTSSPAWYDVTTAQLDSWSYEGIGEWTPDSNGLLLTSSFFSGGRNLTYLDLASKQDKTVIDGKAHGVFIERATPISAVGTPLEQTEFVVTSSFMDDRSSYAFSSVIGFNGWESRTSLLKNIYCTSGAGYHTGYTWDDDKQWNIWGCTGNWYLHSYRNGVLTSQELSAAVNQVPSTAPHIKFLWGGANASTILP